MSFRYCIYFIFIAVFISSSQLAGQEKSNKTEQSNSRASASTIRSKGTVEKAIRPNIRTSGGPEAKYKKSRTNPTYPKHETTSNGPNIIVIIPDDLGWADIGYNGSEILTPHLDQLANTGIKMNQHYVMPTCTPTRVSFLTGKYPSRYGILGPDYGEVIDVGDPTISSLFQQEGYRTAIAGKWHMGSPPYTPLKYGFETSYGYFDGQIDPYTHEYKTETKLTSRQSWHRNDEYLTEEGHATDLITNEALRVINENNESPFFLYLAYSVPHYPLKEPEKWTSMYDHLNISESRKWYAASVTHMDDGIGKIIAALEETGQRENTIILFISDNGGQKSWQSTSEYHGAYADKPHDVLGNNFPLRGWKTDLYEGGIRVPAFVNWEGQLKPGATNIPIHVADWLPTLLQMTRSNQNENAIPVDGIDIWPYLRNKSESAAERTMYWKIRGATAVRKGPWKLIHNRDSDRKELYNLDDDFRESKDLSESNPEKVEELLNVENEIAKADRE